MANGYIGKISAVVTANTSDLSRKLQGAVKDVDRFANTLNRSVSASAQRAAASLENIFTPLQRLERKLQTALRLNLRTAGEVREIQALTQVAEQLNRPLEGLQKRFTGLSLDIQSRFAPALRQAQDQVVAFNDLTSRTGAIAVREFRSTEDAVNRTAQALARLSQAQQLANQGFTGRELQFSSPRAFEVLQSSASTTQRAGQLPADRLADGDIARQVQRLQQFRNAVAQTIAEVEEIRLRPNVDATALAAAERRLASIVETTRRAQRQLDDTIDAPTRAAAAAQRAADNEIALLQRREQAAKQLQDQQNAAAQRAADNEIALLQRREQAAKQAQDRQNALAQRAADNEIALLQRREQAAKQLQDQQNAAAQRAADNEIALLQRREQAAKQLEDERAARLARANELLTIDTAESDRLSRESGLERSAGASTRLIDRIGPSVTALRRQLDGLAEPLRVSVGPEVNRITNKFRLLSREGVAQSAEAVQRLKGEIAGLNAALEGRRSIGQDFLQSFGGSGTAGLGLGVDQRSLRAIGAEIEFVQTRLASLGQQARGPVLAALEALRVAANRLFQDGAIDTDEGRAELERLRQELIRVAATAENVKPDQFGAALKRAGDIARGSFGNVGLAVQQAAFAFEDFFSVTGGLDQRIRAAGNNLSQLGFILGSTKGLIAGIVIGIGAQFAAMLIKWANNGKTAEDQTKALNDALSRQRSTVNDLAQSIRSLSDSLADNVFSNLNGDIRAFEESVARLERRQAQARRDDGAAAGRFDGSRREPLVRRRGGLLQGEADLRRIDRELEAATDPVQAALLARQRRERLDSVNRARTSLAGAPSPSREDLSAILSSAAGERLGLAARDRGAIFRDRLALPQGLQLRGLAQGIAAGTDITARRRQLSSLREAEGILSPIVEARRSDRRLGVLLGDVTVEFERLQQAIALLERDISAAADRDIVSALSNIRSSGESLTKDIQLLESAVADSVTGAVEELAAREALGVQLRAARDALSEAAEIEDGSQRLDAVGRATAELQRIDAAIKARDDEVAAIASTQRSISVFSAALDRVSAELANTVAQEARSAADQARRDANQQQGVLDAGLGGRRQDADAADARASRLADQAADIERRAAAIRADNIRARAAFLGQAAAGGLGDRAQELARSRNAAIAVLENQQAPAGDRINAQAGLEVINQQLQEIFEQSGLAQGAADAANELDRLAAAAKRQDELVQRGRELSRSPAEQAGRQLADDLRALVAARDAGALDGDFAVAGQRIIEDSLRAVAPALFGLADSVQNAVLQGPSRASLEATDVSSVEGARELNRLLRGDDAGRDQNLVELQKQSQSLDELVRIAREGGAVIAN